MKTKTNKTGVWLVIVRVQVIYFFNIVARLINIIYIYTLN